MLHTTPIKAAPVKAEATIEVLLIESNQSRLALRANHILRLHQFDPSAILPAEPAAPSYLRGFFDWRGVYLPLVDLAILLGLKSNLDLADTQQILMLEQAGQVVGLLVESAQQIERVAVADIILLPPIIEQNRLKPVVWALWRRSETELIPLIEPSAALSPDEWQSLSQQGQQITE